MQTCSNEYKLNNYIQKTPIHYLFFFFFFNDTATTEIYTLSLHDALPISPTTWSGAGPRPPRAPRCSSRSEEHTSDLQSPYDLVCRLLLEKKKKQTSTSTRENKKNPNKDRNMSNVKD